MSDGAMVAPQGERRGRGHREKQQLEEQCDRNVFHKVQPVSPEFSIWTDLKAASGAEQEMIPLATLPTKGVQQRDQKTWLGTAAKLESQAALVASATK